MDINEVGLYLYSLSKSNVHVLLDTKLGSRREVQRARAMTVTLVLLDEQSIRETVQSR